MRLRPQGGNYVVKPGWVQILHDGKCTKNDGRKGENPRNPQSAQGRLNDRQADPVDEPVLPDPDKIEDVAEAARDTGNEYRNHGKRSRGCSCEREETKVDNPSAPE